MRRVKPSRGRPAAGQLVSSSTRWTTWTGSSTSTAWTARPSSTSTGQLTMNRRSSGRADRSLINLLHAAEGFFFGRVKIFWSLVFESEFVIGNNPKYRRYKQSESPISDPHLLYLGKGVTTFCSTPVKTFKCKTS